MHKKHYTRQRVQRQHRQKRRYAFTDATRIAELFTPAGTARLKSLFADLSQYLRKECSNPILARGLFFTNHTFDIISKKWVYTKIAEALRPMEDGSSPVGVSRNMFFRYLSQPPHSNIGVSEPTLKASVNKAFTDFV